MKVQIKSKMRQISNIFSTFFLFFATLLPLVQLGHAQHEGTEKPESPIQPDKKKEVNSDFEIKLNIENGHIGHVFIGCRDGATDNFDNRIDDMAPPPGMGGVGYTFLVSPDRKYNLYRDIRGFSENVQWVFYGKVGIKPITLSWDTKSIPEKWNLYCGKWDGKSEGIERVLNCREKFSIKRDQTGFFSVLDRTKEKDSAVN